MAKDKEFSIAKLLLDLQEYQRNLSEEISGTEKAFGKNSEQYRITLAEWGAVTTCLNALENVIKHV